MYEAKQNKEKVSRRIDGGGMVRQKRKFQDGRNAILQRTIRFKQSEYEFSIPNYEQVKEWLYKCSPFEPNENMIGIIKSWINASDVLTFYWYGGQKDFIQLLNVCHEEISDWITSKDPSNCSIMVSMGESAWANDKSTKYILGSGGAAHCIIVLAYSKTNNSAYVAHVQAKTNLSCLSDQIKSSVGTNIDLYLCSSIFSSSTETGLKRNLTEEIKNKIGDVKVVIYPFTSIAINLKTGEIRSKIKACELYFPNKTDSSGSEVTNLTKIYRGFNNNTFARSNSSSNLSSLRG